MSNNKRVKYEDSDLYKIRHSCEHVYAQAISELYPGKIKLAVAHIDEMGFSNDAKWDIEFSDKEFEKIEKKNAGDY
ncbi:MAG: hypothetical protein Q9M91_08505 [Candidatus Dojkabacteria bacterium]|nr:hypothetical protein [Candidatus Dojkabacteria bacterium]